MQLVDLAENRGVDYSSWAQRAVMILRDDPRTLAHLGELDLKDVKDDQRLAGISEDRRIELCANTLGELPAKSRVVVWLAVGDAILNADWISNGPVQIFDAKLWPTKILSGSVRSAGGGVVLPLPPELSDAEFANRLEQATDRIRDQDGTALARVSFENSTPTAARAQAQTVVRGLIDLSNADTTWRVLEGHMTWTPTSWAGVGFNDPSTDEHRKLSKLATDVTHDTIQQFDSELLTRWLAGEQQVRRGVDDALWVATLKRTQSFEQRVILAVRGVEHALGHLDLGDDADWVGAARRYLRSTMVNHYLLNELVDALFCAANAAERTSGVSSEISTGIKETFSQPGTRDYTLPEQTKKMASTLPPLVPLLAPGSMEERIVREAVEVLTEADAALKRLFVLGQRADRMLDRANRQRNAIVHGTGSTEAVIQNVEPFIVRLADYAADEPLRRAKDGRELLSDFEKDRVQTLERERNLKAGAKPADVLWSDEHSDV